MLIKLKHWLHYAPAMIAFLMFLFAARVLSQELSSIHFADVMAQLHNIPWYKVSLAFLFTAISYFSLTNYDRLALKYINHELNIWKTRAISFTAFAVGHTVGVSTISGGSIRYRAYSTAQFSAIEIASIIAFCTLTFGVGASLLLGMTLLLESTSSLAGLGVSDFILTILTILFIALTSVYLLLSVIRKQPIRVGQWSFSLPDKSIAFQQVLFASIDLLAAAATLYILLPDTLSLNYPVLLGAYLIAIFLGVISNVPGGIGVFEGTLLLLLPDMPKVELLGAIIAYRVIYYLVPLGLAIVLMSIHEFAMHRQHVTQVLSKSSDWISNIAPQLLGTLVFITGIGLLISGSLPGVQSRLNLLSNIIPLSLLETSHLLNSVIGVGLLIVARGLFQRLQSAHHVALILLITGIIVSLGKGLDIEESIALGLTAIIIWISREEFYRPAVLLDQKFSLHWLLTIAAVVAASIWLGLFVHQHVEYRDDLWWKFAFDADVPRMLRAGLVSTLTIAAFGLFRLTQPAAPTSLPATEADLTKVKKIIELSNTSHSNVALSGDKRFLFHPSEEAFIMYQVSGDSWISMGDPIGNPLRFESLVWQFRELSHHYADRCVFYQVSEQHLPLYIDMGLSLSKLGEEGLISLTDFSLEGSRRSELRQARNKAARNDATFEVIPKADVPDVIEKLKLISDQWLFDKSAHEKGFSLGTFQVEYLQNFDIAVIKVKGEITAFTNLWSSGDKTELSIDLMRYSSQAPPGVMDYLFTELLLWGQAQGYEWFSLGMAPLSGLDTHPLASIWNKVGNTIFKMGEDFYNFDGLRRYKQKFDPQWKPLYLAAPGGLVFPRVLIDSTLLISGGLKNVYKK